MSWQPFLSRFAQYPGQSYCALILDALLHRAVWHTVNVIRSPGLSPMLSRIALGIVVWPLLVNVDSALMATLQNS